MSSKEGTKIYVIEGRDNLSEWVPARSLLGHLLSYRDKKMADEAFESLFTKNIGIPILARFHQRYRMRVMVLPKRSNNRGARYVQ